MASGRQVFDACCRFLGEPYSTAPGRTSPTSGYKDCSGLIAAGFEVAQGYELGAYVSVTIFEQSQRAGLEIPFDFARNIVGALFLRPENPYLGWGAAGHIAMSDGRGGTVEATPPRVQRLPLSYNWPWSSRAALLIDVDYSNNGEGGAATPKIRRKRMYSFLCHELYGDQIWLVNADTLQRVYIREWDQFIAEVEYRKLTNYVAGAVVADPNLHRTDELVNGIPLWGNLWAACRDVDEFNDVGTGGGGQPAPIDYAALAKAVNDDAAARMKA